MKCSNCGFENPEKSKYCGKCGKSLVKKKISNKMILFLVMIIAISGIILLGAPIDKNSDNNKITPVPTTIVPTNTVTPITTLPAPTMTILPKDTTYQNFSQPKLTEIILSPLTLSVSAGQTRKFFSVSKDQFGKQMQSTVTWTSSDPGVGIIDNSGLFTAISSGTTIITASSGTISKTATVTVSRPIPVLTKIIVSPSSPSIETGKTQVFTASPKDQFDQPMQTAISWASSDPRVGTINNNGVFTSIATGTTTITAADGSVTGTAIITVTKAPPVLTKIIVNPSSVSVEVGKNQNFQASPYDQYNQPISATISWTSSDPGVGIIDNNGAFTPILQGTTTITAASETVQGTSTVLVTPQSTVQKTITVVYPNGGETWIRGNTYTIRWNSQNVDTNVRIKLKGGPGSGSGGWFTVTVSTPNTGNYQYTVPSNYGWEQYEVYVMTLDEIVQDKSDSFFNIPTSSTGLTAPIQNSPADGTVFSTYPRMTTLQWSSVTGAASYTVEHSYCSSAGCNDWAVDYGPVTGLTTNSYTYEFVGAQPGRWRVWAVDANGNAGPKSGWWGFSYTR